MRSRDKISVKIRGHLQILEYPSLEDYQNRTNARVLIDQTNDIHRENMATVIARALADRPYGCFYYMYFGNGGATVDPLGNVVRNPPNVIGTATLYNSTYSEIVDDRQGAPVGNYITIAHVSAELLSD